MGRTCGKHYKRYFIKLLNIVLPQFICFICKISCCYFFLVKGIANLKYLAFHYIPAMNPTHKMSLVKWRARVARNLSPFTIIKLLLSSTSRLKHRLTFMAFHYTLLWNGEALLFNLRNCTLLKIAGGMEVHD